MGLLEPTQLLLGEGGVHPEQICSHSDIHTKRQIWSYQVTYEKHVFGLWEEVGAWRKATYAWRAHANFTLK